MRLNEIEDTSSILKILNRHFKITGKIDINNGIIDVDGNVNLIKKISKLPVQFGNVSSDFSCSGNQLTTLEGAPRSIGGGFSCSDNQLITLQGAPSSVGGGFNCYNNKLTTLEGAPISVGGGFHCSYNNNMPLLRLLLIKDVKKISLQPKNDIVKNILNKYLGQGRGGALQCAAELTKAGYKGNARL
jgi:hypothetical protein